MADLRMFILTTRPAYLNLSRGAGKSSGSMSSSGAMRLPRRSDSIPITNHHNQYSHSKSSMSSKVLNDLLDTVSSLTSLSDKDRDSIDTQAKVMMRQIKGAIEELESLEQDRRKKQQRAMIAQHSSNAAVAGLNHLLSMAPGAFASSGAVDNMAQHRQGITLYLNERLASLATLHKDQYETRIAREMEKRESSLFKALPKPSGTNGYGLKRQDSNLSTTGSLTGGSLSRAGTGAGAAGLSQRRSNLRHGILGDDLSGPSSRSSTPPLSTRADASSTGVSSSSQYYQQQHQPLAAAAAAAAGGGGFVDPEQDFESTLTAQEQQMLQLENDHIVQKLETELNQVRQLESSMMELSSLHSTIQQHLEVQTLQTNRLHEDALTAIGHIDAGNEQLIKAGKRNSSTRKWILFFLILASFVLLFLDWYD
ncbi:hypothetical protein EDD11_002272 [Mortierella claussenii]|nr:hypothetical protein EDD11_002272 [Mortierella claussenii]